MKLILKQAVPDLGEVGDVVTVKPGYGRNYLLPQGLAYEATEGNLRRIQEERAKSEERAKRDYLEARRRASQVDGVVLAFRERAGGEGDEARLFGSVTSADVAAALNARGLEFEVERRHVILEEPLKTLGSHPVPLRLHPEVEVEIRVEIEREEA